MHYDASGNRIIVEKIYSSDSSKSALADFNLPDPDSDIESVFFEDVEITIHPNPTNGLLSLFINPFEEDNPISIVSVYNVQGKLILQQEVRSSSTVLDLTKHPIGSYVLVLEINTEVITWKIIKK